MEKLNQLLCKNINKLILIFLIVSPFLDLVTSLFINVLKLEFNFVIIIKALFLFILIYYYFVSNGEKNKFLNVFLYLIFGYLLIFGVNLLLTKGTDVFVYEFSNTIKTFFFPITLIVIYHAYKNNQLRVSTSTLVFVLIEYLLLLLLPILTNTGFNSYDHSKLGTIGWFNSTNEIGGIISILLPLLFCKMRRFNKFLVLIMYLFILIVYMTLGTKTPTLALILTTVLIIFLFLYKSFVKKKYINVIVTIFLSLVSIVILFGYIPRTSFYKNILIHLNFLGIDEISDFADTHIIDHFIFSERIKFMKQTSSNYNDSSSLEKIIGIGYVENYGADDVNMKMVEMDYYDIFFRHGILGFIIFFAPLIYVIIKNVKFTKYKFGNAMINFSMVLVAILALFSGHILTAPSVSIIVVFIIINWIDMHKAKKKLLFTAYDLNLGGTETALINLLNRIDYGKYDVDLLLEKKEGIFLDKLNNRVDVQEFKVYDISNKLIRKILNFGSRIWFLIRKYDDYDFSCCYATYSLMGSKLTKIASSNSSIYVHSDYTNIYDDKKEFKNFFKIRKIDKFNKIFFVSNEAKNNFLETFEKLESKCIVLNNFIDDEGIIKLSNEKIDLKKRKKLLFVFVGRLDEKSKKVSKMLEVVNEIRDDYSVELWIIGDGPDKDKYKKYIKTNRLEDNIQLLGMKVNPYPYMKMADYIILTSDYEGFPVVYLESILLEKKIITTIDVSDEYISIPNNYGYVISKDVKQMIKEIKVILDDDKLEYKKIDFKKMNTNKMKKLETIFDEVK